MTGGFGIPESPRFDFSKIKSIPEQLAEARRPYDAQAVFERLVETLRDFESKLTETELVAVLLPGLQSVAAVQIQLVTFIDPVLIIYEGVTVDGHAARIVQHVGQLNILLMRVPREDTAEPRKPIGFSVQQPKE
ncbi:MAG: DUF6173 family protein [Gemmatimonadaceae bacterium]